MSAADEIQNLREKLAEAESDIARLTKERDKVAALLAATRTLLQQGEETRAQMMRQFLGIAPLDNGKYLATPKLASGSGDEPDGVMGDGLPPSP